MPDIGYLHKSQRFQNSQILKRQPTTTILLKVLNVNNCPNLCLNTFRLVQFQTPLEMFPFAGDGSEDRGSQMVKVQILSTSALLIQK